MIKKIKDYAETIRDIAKFCALLIFAGFIIGLTFTGIIIAALLPVAGLYYIATEIFK